MTLSERFEQLRAQFGDLSRWQESELHHVCELQHLASEARSALLQGASGITVADLTRLEDVARTALADLQLPAARPEPKTDTLQVTFCSEPRLDLSRLDDRQLEQLTELSAIASGVACPLRSRRLESALMLARRLDAAEHDGEIVLDDRERIEILNDLHGLLSPLVPRRVFGIADLEMEISRLKVEVEEARALADAGKRNGSGGAPGSPGVSNAPAAVPCTVAESNIIQLNRLLNTPASGLPCVGDHPGY